VETLAEGFDLRRQPGRRSAFFGDAGAFLGTSRMPVRTELLRRVGAVPEQITIQPTNISLRSPLFCQHPDLAEALTYYRLTQRTFFKFPAAISPKTRGSNPRFPCFVVLASLSPSIFFFSLYDES